MNRVRKTIAALLLALGMIAPLAISQPAQAYHQWVPTCAHYDGWRHHYDGAFHLWEHRDYRYSYWSGGHRHKVYVRGFDNAGRLVSSWWDSPYC